jgi:hypothetical protein
MRNIFLLILLMTMITGCGVRGKLIKPKLNIEISNIKTNYVILIS